MPNLQGALTFVASYPKSGNTWCRSVAGTYAALGEDQEQFVKYDDIIARHYQAATNIPLTQVGIGLEAQLRPAAMIELARETGMDDSPTLVKSHHACVEVNGLPLWHPAWTARVVNPIRDPREVCCSAKHHFGFDSYERTAEFMCNDEANIGGDDKPLHHFLGSWSKHVKSWLEEDDLDVYSLRYEDLHANPIEEFTEMLKFLGIPSPIPDRVEKAVEACAFEQMQKREEEVGFPETSDHQDRFFRKGKVDGWKEELPKDVRLKIEHDHAEMMQELDYFTLQQKR